MTVLRTDGVVAPERPSAPQRAAGGTEVARTEPPGPAQLPTGRAAAVTGPGSLAERLFAFARPEADSVALLRADRQMAILATLLDQTADPEANQDLKEDADRDAGDGGVPAADDGARAVLEALLGDVDELVRRQSALIGD